MTKNFKKSEFACIVYWIHTKECADIKTQGYVGVTNNTSKRWARHKADAVKYNSYPIHRVINKYNNDLIYEIVFEGTYEGCLQLESYWRPNKYIGWNIEPGGSLPPSNKGKAMPEKQKKKISKANKGKKRAIKSNLKAVSTRRERGSYKKGKHSHLSKAVEQLNSNNEVIAEFESTRQVYEELKYSQGNVASVCRGERRTANGYKWRYKKC